MGSVARPILTVHAARRLIRGVESAFSMATFAPSFQMDQKDISTMIVNTDVDINF